MIKTIAVHLDSGARAPTRIALALALARRHGSRLVGVAPTGLPDVVVTMSAAVPDAIECVALSAAALRSSAEAAARDFEARGRAAGFAADAMAAHVEIGDGAAAVIGRGRCSDLVVVGQTDAGAPVDGVAADLPQQVLLDAGAPVLVVPYAGTFASLDGPAIVAWKNTRESARALRDALPLLAAAQRVTLVSCEEAGERDADGSLAAAAGWLAAHGVAAETRRESALGDVGERLLSVAADRGAALLVAGGYGHSRLREWALGGVTRKLLERMTLPTLLSH